MSEPTITTAGRVTVSIDLNESQIREILILWFRSKAELPDRAPVAIETYVDGDVLSASLKHVIAGESIA